MRNSWNSPFRGLQKLLKPAHLRKVQDKIRRNQESSFVPGKKSSDEYRVKADCEKFYRRVRLRAHFHNGEASAPQATADTCDPFDKLHNKE